MSEVVLTAEQQADIDAGVAAGKLLQDPTFNSVLNELAVGWLQAIVTTEPKEVKRREDLYFLHVALQSIIGVLRARVAKAIQVQADIDADTDYDNLKQPDAPLMAADGI